MSKTADDCERWWNPAEIASQNSVFLACKTIPDDRICPLMLSVVSLLVDTTPHNTLAERRDNHANGIRIDRALIAETEVGRVA